MQENSIENSIEDSIDSLCFRASPDREPGRFAVRFFGCFAALMLRPGYARLAPALQQLTFWLVWEVWSPPFRVSEANGA